MKAGDWNWYKFLTLVVSGIASIAAVATAIVSWKTMDINDSMHDKIKVLQKESMIHESALSNALDRVNLYGDILSAEGGDRWAYKRVQEYLWSRIHLNDKEAESLSSKLSNGTRHFWGGTNENQTLQNALHGHCLDQVAQVGSLLQHKDFTQRVNALKSISWLRLNSYIPAVVEYRRDEPYPDEISGYKAYLYLLGYE